MLNDRKALYGNYLPGPDERDQLASDHERLLATLGVLGQSWTEVRRDAMVVLAPLLGLGLSKDQRSAKQRSLANVIVLLDDLADVPVCEQEGCLETIEDEDVDYCRAHCRGDAEA